MSRYIDIDALALDIDLSKGASVLDMAIGVIKMVHEAPTADVVEVRHGHWIDKSRNINGLHDPRLDCSVCGHIFWFQGAETFNYCPACGAKMDGERREENEG